MKFNVLIAAFLFVSKLIVAQANTDPIHLWPAQVPEAIEDKHPPVQTPDTSRGVLRITDITDPLLEVFLPPPELQNGASLIILPGGGYQYLAVNIEGYEIAEWLTQLGFTAFVLHYRVPDQPKQALMDTQRALKMVRSRAEGWRLNPEKIGVIGFSAGGNLAAKTTPEYANAPSDTIEHPNFALLIYPAFLAEGTNHTLSPDVRVASNTPPTFLFATADDPYSSQSARAYVDALKDAGISHEFHEFPKGGHGYGLRPGNVAAEKWPDLANKWLMENILRN